MIKVWSIPPSYPLHPWGVGGAAPPLSCVPSDGGFYVQSLHFLCKWGGTHPSHARRDTPPRSEEVTPFPPCSGSRVHPPPPHPSVIMRGVSAFQKATRADLGRYPSGCLRVASAKEHEKISNRISSSWNGRLEKISKISSICLPPSIPMDMYKPQKDARFSYEHT